MKKIFIYIVFLIITCLSLPLYAGQSVCPNGSGGVESYHPRGNPVSGCAYFDAGVNVDQTEYDRIKTLFLTVPQQHIKIVNDVPEEMTSQEKTAVNDAEQAAAISAIDARMDLEPLLKDARDQATQAISDIDAYLAISDSATNAQVRAEVKAIDQRQKKIIKALERIIRREFR